MTLAVRNRLVLFATVFSGLLVVLSMLAVWFLFFSSNNTFEIETLPTLSTFFNFKFSEHNFIATVCSIVFAPIFSFFCLLYIMFYFEKTQSIEITFFAASIFAFSLEILRLAIPFYSLWFSNTFYLVLISRIVLAARFFAFFAFFSSGIFSVGGTTQQLGSALFLQAFVSFALAKNLPMNPLEITSMFFIIPGYFNIIIAIFITLGILSVAIYYLLGKTRNIQEYKGAALGLFLFIFGYYFNGFSDSWLLFFASSFFIIIGSLKFLKRIHKYHLWL